MKRQPIEWEKIFANDMTDKGLPWWLSGKESACNEGAISLIPGSGRSPGGGHGNSLQYSCLENPMDRGAWQATVLESDMTEQLSTACLLWRNV